MCASTKKLLYLNELSSCSEHRNFEPERMPGNRSHFESSVSLCWDPAEGVTPGSTQAFFAPVNFAIPRNRHLFFRR